MLKVLLSICGYLIGIISFSQIRVETVGSPTTYKPINTYTGWRNQGVLTFQGTAEVRYFQPYITNGGYVFFTDTTNTFLEISGFPTGYIDGLEINFSVNCSDLVSSNDLKVECTLDGINWLQLTYDSLFYPNFWEVRMPRIDTSVTITDLHVRFTNTSTGKQCRIDNIMVYTSVLLPINLQQFTSSINDNKVNLFWTATSSGNSETFTVEKSIDALNFETLNEQHTKGSGKFSYSFKDDALVSKAWYRLKIKSKDGTYSYSRILFAQSSNSHILLSLYPLPANDKLQLVISSRKQQQVQLIVDDFLGKNIISKSISLTQGINNATLNVHELENQVYILRLRSSDAVETRRIVINH